MPANYILSLLVQKRPMNHTHSYLCLYLLTTWLILFICLSSLFVFLFIVADCGGLSNITDGMLSYNPQGQDQTLLGATVSYTCNTGYTLSGGNMRTCQTNGNWSGAEPTCDGKYSVLHNKYANNLRRRSTGWC